ncbi:MAG: argininosuccinate lyase [Clostridia bacterium]|nr:argininosuccinate lyase [Clostridia bacterium]
MSKLWGGRFTCGTDKAVDDFNSSIRFDQRLYRHDIMGSVAHAEMLGKTGVIALEDSKAICKALKEVLDDIDAGKVEFRIDAEDIHMNVETLLIEKIGAAGKRLHTGRSRNDQVALDIRMYLKDEIIEIMTDLKRLLGVILSVAEKHSDTILPGYTHLQRAQPITLSHHVMAYYQMFKRDCERLADCYDRTNIMPLGSGALAGTTYPLDRDYVAKRLGFEGVTQNSLDGVSDRDFAAEFLFCTSMIMMHLSRFSEEMVLWSSLEFAFVEMDDAYSTGSSIMPQKKNPDVAELVRGKTGRVYGDLMGLLTVMKGLPLAYNKDMQEDKESAFDAIDTVKMCLPVFTDMLATCTFRKENMYKAATRGFTNATDFADYLVKHGVPFRQAHEITGKLVLECLGKGVAIEELELSELRDICSQCLTEDQSAEALIGEDVYEEISLMKCVSGRTLTGGPAPETVLASVAKEKAALDAVNVPEKLTDTFVF